MLLQVSWWQNLGGVVHGRLLFCGHLWCRGAGSPLYSETSLACSHGNESAPRSTGKSRVGLLQVLAVDLMGWVQDSNFCLPSLQQYTDSPPIFSFCTAHIKQTWWLTSTETIRLIRDGEKGAGVIWRWGGREDLSLHCHHQNDSCIKTGSDESHFNA